MKISLHSDLHTEFDTFPYIPPYHPDVDVLILAGDCFVSGSGYEWIHMLMEEHERTPHVIFVPGNHDFYGNSVEGLNDDMRHLKTNRWDNFYYLNNDSIEIDGVTFIGSCLWSSFDAYGPALKSMCKLNCDGNLSDFSCIKVNDKRMNTTDMEEISTKSQEYLRDTLINNIEKKVFVITHFPPLIECENPRFPTNTLSPYFNNDLSGLIEKFKPEYWAYGHNHYNMSFTHYETQMISNQRGYRGESKYRGDGSLLGLPYDPLFKIEV